MDRLPAKNINLQIIYESGQVFDWKYNPTAQSFSGDILGDYATIKYDNKRQELLFSGTTKEKIAKFFALGMDYEAILKAIKKADPKLYYDAKPYFGLRILRQDPWKMAVTFVCSQQNNIPRIKKMLETLRAKYGKAGAFPTAQTLSKATDAELYGLSLGYRAKYINRLAKNVVNGNLDFKLLEKMPYEGAFAEVTAQYGIGEKVGDCMLLYGLGKTEAFPTDVWVRRAVERRYRKEIQEYKKCQNCKSKKIPNKIIRGFARKKFGENAGYAQQLMFEVERNYENTDKKRKAIGVC